MTKIYAAWGGNAAAMATDISEEAVTVRQWRNRGSIPPEHWAKIIDASGAKGAWLTVSDFGPLPPEVAAVERARRAERDAA